MMMIIITDGTDADKIERILGHLIKNDLMVQDSPQTAPVPHENDNMNKIVAVDKYILTKDAMALIETITAIASEN